MPSFHQGPQGAWGPVMEVTVKTPSGEIVKADVAKWVAAILINMSDDQRRAAVEMVQGKKENPSDDEKIKREAKKLFDEYIKTKEAKGDTNEPKS